MHDDLVQGLIEDSRHGRGRTESPAFTAAIRRGRVLVPALRQAIDAPTYDQNLILEALRFLDPSAARTVDVRLRARIYVDGLRHAQSFDDWGMPGAPAESATALLECGRDAMAALWPLLDDERPALQGESKASTASKAGAHRVCDYALALLSALNGKPFAYIDMPADKHERDRMIARLKNTAGQERVP